MAASPARRANNSKHCRVLRTIITIPAYTFSLMSTSHFCTIVCCALVALVLLVSQIYGEYIKHRPRDNFVCFLIAVFLLLSGGLMFKELRGRKYSHEQLETGFVDS